MSKICSICIYRICNFTFLARSFYQIFAFSHQNSGKWILYKYAEVSILSCLPQFLNHVSWAMWSIFVPRVASSMYEDMLTVNFFWGYTWFYYVQIDFHFINEKRFTWHLQVSLLCSTPESMTWIRLVSVVIVQRDMTKLFIFRNINGMKLPIRNFPMLDLMKILKYIISR